MPPRPTKAMRIPSGDHAGEPPNDRSTRPFPSVRTTLIAGAGPPRPRTNAIAPLTFGLIGSGVMTGRPPPLPTKAQTATATPATPIARASAATATRRPDRSSESSAGRRRWIFLHRSGAGTRSSVPNHSFRSGIVLLQQRPEPPPATGQVDSHGRRRRTEDPGRVPHRVPRVVMENQRAALHR